MTPERWRHIDSLFHSTLECARPDRANFLSQACRGDEDLQNEVETLLLAHEQDGSFLNVPAYEVAAEFFVDDFIGLSAGDQIGPYRILRALARGGMGEVYLAHDSRLGRKIVLKLLPTDFSRDQSRVRRFAQEARAASALNHPNVCVIYEIGLTNDGRHFIAMEYIDGITLRERIRRGPMPLIEALVVAEQIAEALAAAHAAGVIHRDVKPENIMLRKDGYVKVLDFGLAKLHETQALIKNQEAASTGPVDTEPGMQMGTVRYMSPEHLRERPVDERADIWSLGIVLHEMVTGAAPFEARTRNEVIALILKRQPRFAFTDDVSAEYRRIVAKSLSKNRGERYQTVTTLASDLKELHEQLLGKISARTHDELVTSPRATRIASPTTLTGHPAPIATTDLWSSAFTYVSQTAGHLLTEIKQHPKASIFAGLVVVLGLTFGLNPRWLWKRQPIAVPFQNINMRPLTTAGQSVCAAISPEGNLFAHAEKKNGMQELLLTNIATEASSVVVPPSNFKYRGITFSRDTNYLYFTAGERSEAGSLYQVALPNGTPGKIKDGVDSPITFSPTGDRLAFVRLNRSKAEYYLIIAAVDGSEERSIATRRDGNTLSLYGPSWSPDGQMIACGTGGWDEGYHMKLMGFNVSNGDETPIGQQGWYLLSQVAWLGDAHQLIITARERWTSPYQLWRISYPAGESFRITSDTTEYERVSVTRDGNTIVALQNHQVARLWVAPNGDAQHARAITSNVGLTFGLDWTSKGRIIFSSMTGNNLNISSINPDGSNQIQLTVNAGDNSTPAASRDGRFVVFSSNRNGSLNIWRMNADDGNDVRQLTFSDGNFYPSCSPDGQWVAYSNQSSGVMKIYKVLLEGGNPVPVVDHARMPVISPDNQFMAYRYYAEASPPEIAVMPFQGGLPTNHLPIPIMDWQRLQWTSDGRALTYIKSASGISNIWSYDLASGTEKQLTNFASDQVFAYAWSPDFKQLACLRGTEVRDVAIISNQK